MWKIFRQSSSTQQNDTLGTALAGIVETMSHDVLAKYNYAIRDAEKEKKSPLNDIEAATEMLQLELTASQSNALQAALQQQNNSK